MLVRVESYMSYKMDLLSFGFILWNTYSYKTTKRSLFNWQLRAIDLYESDEQIYRYDELEKLKSEEEMPDIIKEYFEIVDKGRRSHLCLFFLNASLRARHSLLC
jgi:hypothetical protein